MNRERFNPVERDGLEDWDLEKELQNIKEIKQVTVNNGCAGTINNFNVDPTIPKKVEDIEKRLTALEAPKTRVKRDPFTMIPECLLTAKIPYWQRMAIIRFLYWTPSRAYSPEEGTNIENHLVQMPGIANRTIRNLKNKLIKLKFLKRVDKKIKFGDVYVDLSPLKAPGERFPMPPRVSIAIMNRRYYCGGWKKVYKECMDEALALPPACALVKLSECTGVKLEYMGLDRRNLYKMRAHMSPTLPSHGIRGDKYRH